MRVTSSCCLYKDHQGAPEHLSLLARKPLEGFFVLLDQYGKLFVVPRTKTNCKKVRNQETIVPPNRLFLLAYLL